MEKMKVDKSILLLFCLYAYPFVLRGAALLSYMILYGIPIIYFILNSKIFSNFFLKVTKKQAIVVFLFLLILVFSVIVPSVHGTNDYTYLNVTMYVPRKIIQYGFLALVIAKKYREKASMELFMYYFCIATSLYVCSTLLFTLLPPVRSLWIGLVSSESQSELLENSYGYAMRVGWMGFSGFRATLKCTLNVTFLVHLLFEERLKIEPKKLVFMLLAALMGNAFYGRTGLLVSVAILGVSLFYYSVLDFRKILWVIGISVIGVWAIVVLSRYNNALNEWYVWMSTPFLNLLRTGSFNNSSTDVLFKDMIFLPEFKTIMFGDGWYTSPSGRGYYMSTDAGFMRQLLFWGMPGVIVTYTSVALLMRQISRERRFLAYMILLGFVLFEVKGEVYYEYIPLLFVFIQLTNWSGKQYKLY